MLEIKKIILFNQEGDFSERKPSKELVVYEKKDNKPIDIFYMPNTTGKTFIFNSLEHLFSYDKSNFIKETNKNLEIKIEFELNNNDYIYNGGYNFYIIKNNDGKEVINFGEILEKSLGIYGVDLDYNKARRNTLGSLNRFVFLSFDSIIDKEESNKVSFIDSRFDGVSKKLILAYFLGADIDKIMFETINTYNYKKNFIKKNEKKFSIYEEPLYQLSLGKQETLKNYEELQENKLLYGDVVIAVKEFRKLLQDYETNFKDNSKLSFLKSELNKILDIKKEIESNISNLELRIKNLDILEQAELSGSRNIFKRKEVLNYEKYKSFKEDIDKYNISLLEGFVLNNVDKSINDFKNFLNELYDEFIDLSYSNNSEGKKIVFNENNLDIDIYFQTSQGIRKMVRVLSFIGLHMYASMKKSLKCFNISFYDTFIENTGEENREILFKTIVNFAKKKNLNIPRMFLFITDIEQEGVGKNSIKSISVEYEEYMNLISCKGFNII